MPMRPHLFALSTNIWPRVAQLGGSPSLLALALIMDGVLALVPGSFRTQKETLS